MKWGTDGFSQERKKIWLRKRENWLKQNADKVIPSRRGGQRTITYLSTSSKIPFSTPRSKLKAIRAAVAAKFKPIYRRLFKSPIHGYLPILVRAIYKRGLAKFWAEEKKRVVGVETYSWAQLKRKNWIIGNLEKMFSSPLNPPLERAVFENLTPPELEEILIGLRVAYPYRFQDNPLYYIRLINCKKILKDWNSPKSPVKLNSKEPGRGWIITPEGLTSLEAVCWEHMRTLLDSVFKKREEQVKVEEEKQRARKRAAIRRIKKRVARLIAARYVWKNTELFRINPTPLLAQLIFLKTGQRLHFSHRFLQRLEQFRSIKDQFELARKSLKTARFFWRWAVRATHKWKLRTWTYFNRFKNQSSPFTADSEEMGRKLLPALIFFARETLNYRKSRKNFRKYVKTLSASPFPRKKKEITPPQHFPKLFPSTGINKNLRFPFSPIFRTTLFRRQAPFIKSFVKNKGFGSWSQRWVDYFVTRFFNGTPHKNQDRRFAKPEYRRRFWKAKEGLLKFYNSRFFRQPNFFFMKLKPEVVRQYFPRVLKTRTSYRIPRLFFPPFNPFSILYLRPAKNRYRIKPKILSFARQLISENALRAIDLGLKLSAFREKDPFYASLERKLFSAFREKNLFSLRRLIRNLPLQYLNRGYSLLPFLGKASDGDYRTPFKYPQHPKFQRVYLSKFRETTKVQPLYDYWAATHYPRLLAKSGFFKRQLLSMDEPVEGVGDEKIGSGLFLSPLGLLSSNFRNSARSPLKTRLYGRSNNMELTYSHRIKESLFDSPNKPAYVIHYKDWERRSKPIHTVTLENPESPKLEKRIFELAEFSNPQERVYRSQYGHTLAPRPRGANAALIARRFLQLFQGTRIGGFAEEGKQDPDLNVKREPMIELLGYKYARLFRGRYNGSVKYLSQRSLFRYINPPKIFWKEETLLYTGHLAKNFMKRFKATRNYKLNYKTRVADEIFGGFGNILNSWKFKRFNHLISTVSVLNKPLPKKLSFTNWCAEEERYWSKPALDLTDDELDCWKSERWQRKVMEARVAERSKAVVTRLVSPLYLYMLSRETEPVEDLTRAQFRARVRFRTRVLFSSLLPSRLQRLWSLLFRYNLIPNSPRFFFFEHLEDQTLGQCFRILKFFKERLQTLVHPLALKLHYYEKYLFYLATFAETRFRPLRLLDSEALPFDEKMNKLASVFEHFRAKVANRLLRKKPSHHPMLIVNTAKNNIFLTVTDYVGRVLTRVSGGSIDYMGSKFEGKKRSTAHATYQATAVLIRWFAKRKIRKIQLFFKCRRDYHTKEVIRALENLSSDVSLKVSRVHIRFRHAFSRGPRPKRKRYV